MFSNSIDKPGKTRVRQSGNRWCSVAKVSGRKERYTEAIAPNGHFGGRRTAILAVVVGLLLANVFQLAPISRPWFTLARRRPMCSATPSRRWPSPAGKKRLCFSGNL